MRSNFVICILLVFSLYDLLAQDSLVSINTQYQYKDYSVVQRTFDDQYKDKYKGEAFQYADKKKNALERWLDRKPKKKQTSASPIWSLLFKTIIILALIYAVFVIVGMLMGKKGNWLFNKKSESRALQYGIDEEDLNTSNFAQLIDQAVASGDFRQAVRYQYLNTLQKMDQKGIIKYHKEKTNADYRYEIKKSSLAEAFQYISYIYDHAWYGGFDVSQHTYTMAALAYDDTNKLI